MKFVHSQSVNLCLPDSDRATNPNGHQSPVRNHPANRSGGDLKYVSDVPDGQKFASIRPIRIVR
jgi:hypothetical protein